MFDSGLFVCINVCCFGVCVVLYLCLTWICLVTLVGYVLILCLFRVCCVVFTLVFVVDGVGLLYLKFLGLGLFDLLSMLCL